MDESQHVGSPSTPGPRRGLIRLEPMTVGAILDGAFSLLRATIALVALVVAVAYVPFEIVSTLVTVPVLETLPDPATIFGADGPSPTFEPSDFAPLVAVGLVLGLVGWLLSVLVSGAVTVSVARYEDGTPVEWRDAYRASWRRFGALLGASVLLVVAGLLALLGVVLIGVALGAAVHPAVGVIVGLGALVPVGLVLIAISYVSVPVIVLEGRGPAKALGRTWRLLRPRLAGVMGIVLLAVVIIGIVAGIVGIVFGLVAQGLSLAAAPLGWIAQGIGNVLVQILVLPLVANLALLLYFDARVRHEGLDIEVLAGQGGMSPP